VLLISSTHVTNESLRLAHAIPYGKSQWSSFEAMAPVADSNAPTVAIFYGSQTGSTPLRMWRVWGW